MPKQVLVDLDFNFQTLLNARLFDFATEGSGTLDAVKSLVLPVDVSGGAATVNPPSGTPQPKDWFGVVDSRAKASLNNIDIDFTTAGDNFHGESATDYAINVDRGFARFIYVNSVIGWILF